MDKSELSPEDVSRYKSLAEQGYPFAVEYEIDGVWKFTRAFDKEEAARRMAENDTKVYGFFHRVVTDGEVL